MGLQQAATKVKLLDATLQEAEAELQKSLAREVVLRDELMYLENSCGTQTGDDLPPLTMVRTPMPPLEDNVTDIALPPDPPLTTNPVPRSPGNSMWQGFQISANDEKLPLRRPSTMNNEGI